ncbi:MAG: HAMP domain-containing histidine kinase, partial [Deltaproteobacteria bacterium]
PRVAADGAARRIAGRIATRLGALVERESARPFFHYQNLYVDPRGAYAGPAVTPSPLAEGPSDPLIVGNFQIDEQGNLTLPTINPEIAELNVDNGVDQDELRSRLVKTVEPYVSTWLDDADGQQIAAANLPEPLVVTDAVLNAGLANQAPEVEQALAPNPRPVQVQQAVQAPQGLGLANEDLAINQQKQIPNQMNLPVAQMPVQEQRIDQSAYLSNRQANEIYRSIQSSKKGGKMGVVQALEPTKQAAVDPGACTGLGCLDAVPQSPPSPEQEDVVVRVGSFAWHTVPASEATGAPPFLVALRRVETPDGVRVQGFEVDLATLTDLLVEGDLVGRLAPGPGQGEGVAPVPLLGSPWHVAVDYDAALEGARLEAADLGRSFHWRFGVGVGLAVLAGLAVILMIAHAERLSRRRVQFAASAAHELRTPLAGVRMYGEMLAEGLGNPDRQRTYARRVATEADRLGRVVSNVLDFTRLERGNLAVAPAPGDLGQAVQEIVQRIAPTLQSHGATVAATLGDGALHARFDRDAVAQIVSNLVDNAEKYTRHAADRAIAVHVAHVQGGVRVSVRDHGEGIAPGLRRRLFRAFSRGRGADHPAGLGLGLALTRALVEAQGGRVDYRDADGGGAEFGVTLPAVDAPA